MSSMTVEANSAVQPANFTGVVSSTQNLESWLSDDVKTKINLTFNGVAAASNLLTTINGNFSNISSIQEPLEKASAFLSKSATAIQGLLNAQIALEKKNIVALIGGLLELPIAVRVKGFYLFLARGVSAGLNHFDSIISRTKKTLNGLPVLDELGNPQYYDDFKKEGWIEGFKTIYRHIPILAKELYQKPREREGLFSRSFFLCSSFMILGSLVALMGLKKTGATIRHIFGGLAGVALTTDKLTNTNVKQREEGTSKGLSDYAYSGIFWIFAAIPDILKHYDFFSDRIKNGTELALCFDRLGGLFFIRGNQRIKEK